MSIRRMCDVLLSALIAGVLYTACGVPEAPAQNVTCATRPSGDSSNACASTAFVQGAIPLIAITGLTGDGTATGPGVVPFTLASVNGNVGSWGSATQCPTFTVNAKGLITAASQTACIAGLTVNSTTISGGTVNGILFNKTAVLGDSGLGVNGAALVAKETSGAVYYNVLGSGAAPTVLQLYAGSAATPITSISPTTAISRYEAISANTEGGQNAALLVNVTGNNTSTVGHSSQVNGITTYTKQIGTGDVVGGYFASIHNGATLSGHHYASYGVFAVAQGNAGTNSAIGGNFVVDNASGSDCTYAGTVPGGTTCAEMGIFIQAIGANLHSAGVMLFSNLGKFDCGFCVYSSTVNTYAFRSPGFSVNPTGDVVFDNLSANVTWTAAAVNAGIDFGGGSSSITRRSSDGRLRYVSQIGVHEFLDVGGPGTSTVLRVGEAGGSGGLQLYGSTSGSVTIATQAVAGTPTLTLPNASGTFAISATSPIVLSATTGALTCPTCATTSGGGTISTLTFGTHLTSGGSSYNGSAGVTISTDATNANTASTIVARDASGNFTAGNITATTFTGSTITNPSANLAVNTGSTFILFQFSGTNAYALNSTIFTPSNDNVVQIGQSSLRFTTGWFSTYLLTSPVAVASLPTCNGTTEGARSAVNNSNAASYTAGIGAVVAAGGTTHVPVFCDGTNWRIG